MATVSSTTGRFRTLAAYCIPLVLGLVALTGCSSQPAIATHTPNTTQAPVATTRTVVDLAGRTVTIPARVGRIGTNYPAVNQMIFMLGGMDRLVATDQGEASNKLFETIYPRLKNIPAPFGASTTDVNVEALAGTRPDVVFLSSNSPMVAKLQNLGITAVVLSVFNTPAQLKAGVKLVADVLGGDAPTKAQHFSQYYDGNVARAASATAKIPAANQPKVFYTAGDPLQTEGNGSIVTIWMKEAGGRNIAAENGISAPPTFSTVSIEDVVRWNPDFIVCRDTATKQQILQDPRWRGIAAVRDNRVLINPKGVFVWSVRSGESALQPLWAAKTFHSDLFADLDMRKEVRNFYQTFYSYKLSDQQLDGILSPAQP
jgi:iron complex transport system substrate-binding protein